MSDKRAAVGGGNLLEIFDLGTDGTFGDSIARFDKTVTTTVNGHPMKKSMTIDLDSKIDDEEYNDFLNTYLSDKKVETLEVEYEDSSTDKIISGVDNTKAFGFIWYGAAGPNGKRKIVMGRGILTGETGNFSTQAKNFGSMPVQITVIDGLALSIATDKFDASKVVVAIPYSISSSEFGMIDFVVSA